MVGIKGFIFKYRADSKDNYMKDTLGTKRDCGLGLRDPDFWSNDFPVWGVCGPYYRKALDIGDVIFFAPKKVSITEAGLSDYICTGILVVANVLPSLECVMADARLTVKYKEKYKADLDAHLKKDKERTKKVRPCNFIIGEVSKSRWFGKNKNRLTCILQKSALQNVASKLSIRRIPSLNKEQVRRIYKQLMGEEL